MHKQFYSSGFLYHLPTHQILLHKSDADEPDTWTYFSGKSKKGENPETVFCRIIEETLGVKISSKGALPIYDYIHDTMGECFLFYAIVPSVSKGKNEHTQWHPFAALTKMKLPQQARHDIMIAERVIRAAFAAAHPQPEVRRNL